MFRALLCPSSGARQTVVAASGFRMSVEVEMSSTVVGLLVGRHCPSSGARQTVVAASGFRMNVEVEVFSAVVGLSVGGRRSAAGGRRAVLGVARGGRRVIEDARNHKP
jgi:hypothetical protein